MCDIIFGIRIITKNPESQFVIEMQFTDRNAKLSSLNQVPAALTNLDSA